MTRQTPVDEAKKDLDTLVDEVGKGGLSVILEKDGQPTAVLVSLADYERLKLQRQRFFDLMEGTAGRAAEVASQEEIQAAIDEAVREVREARRLRLAT